MSWYEPDHSNKLDRLERVALSLMAAITLLTFVGTNMQAVLWQSSDWLVGTVLPAVVVNLTNDQRGGYAAAPLRHSSTLDAAAQQKAQHMAAHSYFAHFAPDGTSPWYFFDQAGYAYAHAGENLAVHFTDSAQIVQAWMQSPAHKENIINRDYTEIGVGTARGTFDGHETIYVVQLFGTPAVAPGQAVAAVMPPTPTPAPVESDIDLDALRAQLVALQQQTDALATPSARVAQPVTTIEPTNAVPTQLDTPTIAPGQGNTGTPVVAPVASTDALPQETLVLELQIATSSGLAVAHIVEPLQPDTPPVASLAAAATRPNLVLDVMYSLLLGTVLVLLSVALVGETRRLHFVQAFYSLALLGAVGGLWYAHTALTSGAVVL